MKAALVTFQVMAPWLFTLLSSIAAFNALAPIEGVIGQTAQVVAGFFVFVFGFPIFAAAFSIPFRGGIKTSLLPRTISNTDYFIRRLHACCWSNVYYFIPIYQLVLTLPFLFKTVFRMFGYTGSTKITVFPDTWIRDLPILKISDGAYLANKATVGTNLCLANGKILVQTVEIGESAILGHLAAIGPGVSLGKKTQVGVNCGIGVRTKLAENVDIGLYSFVHHGVSIGANTTIGARSFIGLRSKVGSDITIPAGTNLPGGSVILSQSDLQTHQENEKSELNSVRMAAVTELATGLKNAKAATSNEKDLAKVT